MKTVGSEPHKKIPATHKRKPVRIIEGFTAAQREEFEQGVTIQDYAKKNCSR
jgi:hypothetical protein